MYDVLNGSNHNLREGITMRGTRMAAIGLAFALGVSIVLFTTPTQAMAPAENLKKYKVEVSRVQYLDWHQDDDSELEIYGVVRLQSLSGGIVSWKRDSNNPVNVNTRFTGRESYYNGDGSLYDNGLTKTTTLTALVGTVKGGHRNGADLRYPPKISYRVDLWDYDGGNEDDRMAWGNGPISLPPDLAVGSYKKVVVKLDGPHVDHESPEMHVYIQRIS